MRTLYTILALVILSASLAECWSFSNVATSIDKLIRPQNNATKVSNFNENGAATSTAAPEVMVQGASSVINILMLQAYTEQEGEKPDANPSDFVYLNLKIEKVIRRPNICNNGTRPFDSTDSRVANVSICVRGTATDFPSKKPGTGEMSGGL